VISSAMLNLAGHVSLEIETKAMSVGTGIKFQQ